MILVTLLFISLKSLRFAIERETFQDKIVIFIQHKQGLNISAVYVTSIQTDLLCKYMTIYPLALLQYYRVVSSNQQAMLWVFCLVVCDAAWMRKLIRHLQRSIGPILSGSINPWRSRHYFPSKGLYQVTPQLHRCEKLKPPRIYYLQRHPTPQYTEVMCVQPQIMSQYIRALLAQSRRTLQCIGVLFTQAGRQKSFCTICRTRNVQQYRI